MKTKMMKNIIVLTFITLIFGCKSTKSEHEKNDKIVAEQEAIIPELKWHTNMTEATDLALKQKKPLFLFFTGSDWCGWCIRLQNEVFKTDEFKKWAHKNVVLVELDFPRRTPIDENIKKQNFEIQNKFQVRGYPTVWFVKPTKTNENAVNLNGIGSSGYMAGGPTKWIESANLILQNNN